MKYVYTFSETNYGRIEIDAVCRPTDGEIIEKILEGMADYNDTDFTCFKLIEVDGKALDDYTEIEIDRTVTWRKYLRYLRNWADTHSEPSFYGMAPACFEEWLDNEHWKEQNSNIHEAGVCPKCGSESLDFDGFFVEDGSGIYKWECESCGTHGREYYDMTFSEHIIDSKGECPHGGDTNNDCADCVYAGDYHYETRMVNVSADRLKSL